MQYFKFFYKIVLNIFAQILHEEKTVSENLIRAVTKPLSVTQIEERAIAELEKLYNVDNCFDEAIRVTRCLPYQKLQILVTRTFYIFVVFNQ
jgi:hypothetical protein